MKKCWLRAEKEKMRANLLRAVSHDLRTPLTGIIGASSPIWKTRKSWIRMKKGRWSAISARDANWLLNMVENLLTVTRIRNDSASVNKSLEPVEEVMSEAVFRLKREYRMPI